MRRLALMLLLILSLTACAHQALPPGQPPASPDRTAQALHTLFPVALKAGVTLSAQSLLAFHPDVLPYLRPWLDALCATVVNTTDTHGLQVVMLATLDTITMPSTVKALLADFVPVVVGLVPVALQVAEISVPEVGSVMVVVGDICKAIEQALPPAVAMKP